jgi:hypothetical protein
MTCCVFERGITAAVVTEGSMTTLMFGEEALTLVLGEEGLPVVLVAAKTEGSILQKMSRKQKLTNDNFQGSRNSSNMLMEHKQ